MEELNSGPLKTDPSSGREEDLNPGPPDYKFRALTTKPRCLLSRSFGVHNFFLRCDLIKKLDLKGDFGRLFCTALHNTISANRMLPKI